jgi:hypothetical protein
MRAHKPWIELSRPQVMLLQREHGQRASRASVGLQVACVGACACNDGWSQRQVRWQERGRRWCRLERGLPSSPHALFAHPVCSCVALQQAVSYASIYKAKGRHQLIQRRACSRWDQGSPLGQPGRACSRVVATVMPCTRALCVRAGPVGRCAEAMAEAAVGESVGRREGVPWGLGALCARNPLCTRPPWPWLAMARPC